MFSPHDSDPDSCEEPLLLSETVLISLDGDGRCHGEEPLLPSRLLAARCCCPTVLGCPVTLCGVCIGNALLATAPPGAEIAEPCGDDAGVPVDTDT